MVFDCAQLLECSNANIDLNGNTICNTIDVLSNLTLTASIEGVFDRLPDFGTNNDTRTNRSIGGGGLATTRPSSNTTLTTVHPYDFFNTGTDFASFLTNNSPTGIYFSGNNCTTVINCILNGLGENCSLVNDNTFYSTWALSLIHI